MGVWADIGRPTAALALSGFSFCMNELVPYRVWAAVSSCLGVCNQADLQALAHGLKNGSQIVHAGVACGR